jgi:hypothetical protein
MFFSAYLLSNLQFWRVRARSLAPDRCSVLGRDVWRFWHNFDIGKPAVKERQEQDSKLGWVNILLLVVGFRNLLLVVLPMFVKGEKY